MKVEVYFSRLHKLDSVTFIKVRARKDNGTPFYHAEYQTTPTNMVEQWRNSNLMDYIVLNDNQPQIEWLCGGYVKSTRCMLIISEEDFALLYPNAEQRQSMIDFIDKKING